MRTHIRLLASMFRIRDLNNILYVISILKFVE